MGKTVYVLGAGSSILAKLPTQSEILRRIFDQEQEGFIVSSDPDILKVESRYNEARMNISEFILNMFSEKRLIDFAPEHIRKDFEQEDIDARKDIINNLRQPRFMESIYTYIKEHKSFIALEDLFTILDKAVISNEHIHGYDISKIIRLREDLILCIVRIFMLANSLSSNNQEVYKIFVTKLIQKRMREGQSGDPVSVITLNWDFIIDSYFNRIVQENPEFKDVKMDYCVYDYSYNIPESNLIPSTLLKKKGYYNFKLLKLHGAMNWLICKNCQRLYYSYNEFIAIKEFFEKPPVCRYCQEHYNSYGESNQIKLKSELITPTLLKNLDSVNFKSIWKNASIEFSEAEKIVFMGYSMPQADFDFRYMLKKSVKPSTEIDVVLSHNDDPKLLRMRLKNPDDWTNYLTAIPENRYRSFFGHSNLHFHYDGIEEYVKNRM